MSKGALSICKRQGLSYLRLGASTGEFDFSDPAQLLYFDFISVHCEDFLADSIYNFSILGLLHMHDHLSFLSLGDDSTESA